MSEKPNGEAKSDSVRTTVYFDGACPLCTQEIDFYRVQQGGSEMRFVDVSTATENIDEDLARHAAMQRFHVRNSDRRLLSGAAAFAALWIALPRFRILGKIVQLPLILPVAEAGYRAFLRFRPILQRLARRKRNSRLA
jgi:predicted DCC family thiol-disulfide oxidoreductase YuxK